MQELLKNTRARGQPEQNCQTMPTVETDQAELSLVKEMGEDQVEQSQDESLSPIGRRAEHQSLTGGQAAQSHDECSSNPSSSPSITQPTRQPLTIPRAVARYVDGPIDISHESEIINCNLGTTFGDEDRAEQLMSGGPCHHFGVGAL